MGAYELIGLGLGVTLVAGVGTGVEWMPRYLKRQANNDKLGVGVEPELRGELVKAFVVVWLCRAVQLGMIGVAVLAPPAGLGWIAVVGAFVVSFGFYLSADHTRRSLLA